VAHREDDSKTLREQLIAGILAAQRQLPTSTLGRFSRLFGGALRSGRLWRRGATGDELDVAQLTAAIASVGQLKGVAMKVGQIFSFAEVAMPEELRTAFSVLQTHSPPMPFARVTEIVQADLGERARQLLAHMEPVPVAAASIGQVHRARLPDGATVAVKVRYPEIEKAIASDFRPAAMGTRFASLFYRGANVDGFVREARDRFLEECDYLREASAQIRFARLYGNHPVLTVPRVHEDYCSRRILTSDWAEGLHFDAWLASAPRQSDRDRLGEALFEFYVGSLFLHGLYNCDPHPGNYVFAPDGRIVMLDYGCTREFDRAWRSKLAALSSAVQSDDRDQLHRVFVGLGMVQEGRAYDFATARRLVRSFYGPMLRDEVLAIEPGAASTLGELAQNKRELMKLTLPAEFLFLLRIRFGLISILSRMGARANWYRLERRYVSAFLGPNQTLA
jgi:predicted unusual protein kinase regulating ubiquinone biosynthesis (AarF/ABC1/UbiB family)